jgi:hypothetical protein
MVEAILILLARVSNKRAEKSLILTGLRGVGKTVLLNEMEKQAITAGCKTVFVEAHTEKSLAALLAPYLRTLLFELNRLADVGNKVRKALAVLRSFLGTVNVRVGDLQLGLDLEPLIGVADSGDLEADLPALFLAIAEAAEERNTVVALFIDEIQYFSQKELSALIMAMHKLQQKSLPLVLIGAGLPILPGLAGESKTYAERLFNFPQIGALSATDTKKALQEPAKAEGAKFTADALKEIFRLTKGYPYFIQEWGYQAWNFAAKSPITFEDVSKATAKVKERLDENFFKVRFDRVTPKEKQYLRAMAELGEGPYKAADIAAQFNKTSSGLGPVRAGLIKKGMVYSPQYGYMAFTVPLFAEFMRRIMP